MREYRNNHLYPDFTEVFAGGAQMAVAMPDTIRSVVSGTGSVAVAETVEVTAPSGIIVQHVLVEKGDRVNAGDPIAELNMTSILRALTTVDANISSINTQLRGSGLNAIQREQLQAERDDLQETRNQLAALKENPYIIAAIDGVINDLYLTDGAEISRSAASNSNNSNSDSGSDYGDYGYGYSGGMMYFGAKPAQTFAKIEATPVMTLLTGEDEGNPSDGTGTADTPGESQPGGDQPGESQPAESQPDGDQPGGSQPGTPVQAPLVQITDFRRFILVQPSTGNTPQDTILETRYYTGEITWTPAHASFEPNTSYTATSVLTAKDGYTFEGLTFVNMPNGWLYEVSDDGTQLTITSTFERTAATAAPLTPQEPETIAPVTDPETESEPETEPLIPDLGGFDFGGGGADVTGSYGADGSQLSGSVTNSNSLAVVCTIAKPDTAKITLNVDEADILSVHEGQTATITLDAFADQTFEGTVTRVSQTASSGGGSAKYTVEITFERDENMFVGMSASAEIFVANAEDVITIPMLALQQAGDQTFVYTEVDEDGNLGGETQITTGVSDGTNVEVTEGLSEGDTVYYYRIGGDEDWFYWG